MQIKGWRYYNHAAIPDTPPCEEPNLLPVEDRTIWRIGGGMPLLARWTSEFDCGCETNWWYVIKDTPFDVSALKAKRRYEINKGIKYFEIKQIDPWDFKEELFDVQVAAFSAYPPKYRPVIEKTSFQNSLKEWDKFVVLGSFFRETGALTGYALLHESGSRYVDFRVLKTIPDYEKYGVNAALVEGVLRHFSDFLRSGGILCDGARSINHETAFQDYLEKYFGFRKAYCRLHIQYNPKIRWCIRILFPLRKLLLRLDFVGSVHQVNAILKMEELVREQK